MAGAGQPVSCTEIAVDETNSNSGRDSLVDLLRKAFVHLSLEVLVSFWNL